jgi:uncharacterized protein YcfJ
MRRTLLIAGLAALVAAPSVADASCKGRKDTGTAIGAIAGGLLGNAVAGHGAKTGGTLLGAGVGAVVGHEVAKSGCGRARASTRHRSYAHRSTRYSYAANTPVCRYETRPFYNQRGELVYAPTQVCR